MGGGAEREAGATAGFTLQPREACSTLICFPTGTGGPGLLLPVCDKCSSTAGVALDPRSVEQSPIPGHHCLSGTYGPEFGVLRNTAQQAK